MKNYAIYLRKSRADKELEKQGETETLARHETMLKALAEKQQLYISKIYKEVVSGETITSRPQMQQLLHDVEQGLYDGVLVMEIERLARGDTIDQGVVAQTFKYANTLIITPNKTYNPNNEFDEEYFEFGLFMSRREYKTINRRLQAGRLQSVKEGKFVGNTTPFGYKKVKLKGEKGYTLEPVPEQAEVVKLIFKLYAYGDENGIKVGFGEIASRLHKLGFKSATGLTQWQSASVRDILSNPVYIGKIRWGLRPQRKAMVDGVRETKRTRIDEPPTYDGLHPAIIDEETFNIVQERRKENKKNTRPKSKKTQNPLAGICYCKKCGKSMQRRPYTNGYADGLICVNRYCNNVSADLWRVENAVLEALKKYVDEYKLNQIKNGTNNNTDDDIKSSQLYIESYKEKLAKLEKQLERIYESYELGIYDADTFMQRSEKIKSEKAEIQKEIDKLNNQINKLIATKSKYAEFIPKVENLLSVYNNLSNAEDKNIMLKNVLTKITYYKESTARFTKDYDNFEVIIYPKISE